MQEGRTIYRITDPHSLKAFVGPTPAFAPNWNAVFSALWRLVELERLTGVSDRAFVAEAHDAAEAVSDDLEYLDISTLRWRGGTDAAVKWLSWIEGVCGDLAMGRWPGVSSPFAATSKD